MSKGRRHVPTPPARPKAVDPPDAFAGKSYRVKQVLVKLEVDTYDDAGKYESTIYTDPPIPLPECDWPAGFEKLILSKTPNLKRGFRADGKAKAKPVEQAAETA